MRAEASPSDLLEREDDLARIGGALRRTRGGQGTLVVVEGPAGVGKTALLADARAMAESAGMQVLRSRGAELEREFGFGVVRQLVEPALRAMDDPTVLYAGPAGVAAGLLGLPGRTGGPERRSPTTTRRSRFSTVSTGSAPTSPSGGRCAWSSTTRTGPTSRRCGS